MHMPEIKRLFIGAAAIFLALAATPLYADP